jgi:hypothetical protein
MKIDSFSQAKDGGIAGNLCLRGVDLRSPIRFRCFADACELRGDVDEFRPRHLAAKAPAKRAQGARDLEPRLAHKRQRQLLDLCAAPLDFFNRFQRSDLRIACRVILKRNLQGEGF